MVSSLLLCALSLFFAYLLGSFPTGYLAGRLLKGIDIREQGSGSTGATNVLRTIGRGPAAVVLFVDALKGVAAVVLVNFLFATPVPIVPLVWQPWLVSVAALMAVIGHSKSIWLGFQGGKSVATSLGVLLAMAPWVGLSALLVFSGVLVLTRIVSLSSISGAIAVALFMVLLNQPLPYQLFGLATGAYVIWRHASNIQRLLAGTEPRLGQSMEAANSQGELST